LTISPRWVRIDYAAELIFSSGGEAKGNKSSQRYPISEERAEVYRTEESNGELTVGAGGSDGALDVYNLWLLSPIVGAA
jgi:hypothetical protein